MASVIVNLGLVPSGAPGRVVVELQDQCVAIGGSGVLDDLGGFAALDGVQRDRHPRVWESREQHFFTAANKSRSLMGRSGPDASGHSGYHSKRSSIT